MNETTELITDIKRMLGRMGMDAATIDSRINDALMNVLAEGLGQRVTAPGPRQIVTRYRLADDAGGVSVGDPVAAVPSLPASQGGKFFRGSGKHAIDEKGDRVEIGTWMNPAGEFEAQRLTKETGVQHFVNPKTGDVESIGHVADKLAQASPVPDSPALTTIGGPTMEGVLPS